MPREPQSPTARILKSLAPLVVLAACAGSARAEFFAYGTSVSVDLNGKAGVNVSGNGTDYVSITTPNGGTVNIWGTSDGVFSHLVASDNGTDIVFGYISPSTFPTDQQDLTINFAYTLSLTAFKNDTGGVAQDVQTMPITGQLSGSVGSGRRVNLNDLKGYATNPADGIIQIGASTYQVTLNPFTFPGATPGAFGAHIRTVSAVPEPGSLVLIGLGGVLGLAGFVDRRRRRGVKVAEPADPLAA